MHSGDDSKLKIDVDIASTITHDLVHYRRGCSMLDTLDPQASSQIAAVLEKGATAEGPIHVATLVKRVADGMSIGRLRTEHAESIKRLIPRQLPRTAQTTVVWPAGADRTVTPVTGAVTGQRAFQEILLIALGDAMVPIVNQSMCTSQDELFRLKRHEFHAEGLTRQVRERLELALRDAVKRGRLAVEEDLNVRGEQE